MVLSLGAKGKVRYKDYALACDQGVSLCVLPDGLRVHLPDNHAGALAEIDAPGAWTIDTGQGAQISRTGQRYLLQIRADTRELKLFRE